MYSIHSILIIYIYANKKSSVAAHFGLGKREVLPSVFVQKTPRYSLDIAQSPWVCVIKVCLNGQVILLYYIQYVVHLFFKTVLIYYKFIHHVLNYFGSLETNYTNYYRPTHQSRSF